MATAGIERSLRGGRWVRLDVRQARGRDADGLMAWLFASPPERCGMVHGEAAAADALRLRNQVELGWRVTVPEHGAMVEV